jgi:outer membrane receptor for ferric coprogen and ferric-rhodotorulic acid
VRLDLAYSSATHRYEEWVIPVGATNRSYAGKTIEGAPHTLANVLLTYSPALLDGGRVAAEWTHTGRYYADPENTRTYGGFDLWTMHASYVVGDAGELFVRATNLANERFAEVAAYNAFNGWQYTPGAPRSVYAGVRYNWQR